MLAALLALALHPCTACLIPAGPRLPASMLYRPAPLRRRWRLRPPRQWRPATSRWLCCPTLRPAWLWLWVGEAEWSRERGAHGSSIGTPALIGGVLSRAGLPHCLPLRPRRRRLRHQARQGVCGCVHSGCSHRAAGARRWGRVRRRAGCAWSAQYLLAIAAAAMGRCRLSARPVSAHLPPYAPTGCSSSARRGRRVPGGPCERQQGPRRAGATHLPERRCGGAARPVGLAERAAQGQPRLPTSCPHPLPALPALPPRSSPLAAPLPPQATSNCMRRRGRC